MNMYMSLALHASPLGGAAVMVVVVVILPAVHTFTDGTVSVISMHPFAVSSGQMVVDPNCCRRRLIMFLEVPGGVMVLSKDVTSIHVGPGLSMQ